MRNPRLTRWRTTLCEHSRRSRDLRIRLVLDVARHDRRALVLGQTGDRLDGRRLGQQLERLHVLLVEHDRLHLQRLARPVLHASAPERLQSVLRAMPNSHARAGSGRGS